MANTYYNNTRTFTPGTAADGNAVDDKFDAIGAGLDGVEGDIQRSIKMPAGTTGDQAIIENAAGRVDKAIGFDTNGDLVLHPSATANAAAAATSESNAAADVVLTHADVVLTHADVALSSNNAAAASVSEVNAASSAAKIPTPSALYYIRGNTGGTAYESRTSAQVKTDISLGNVDNTSDANKPISTATQTALNLKEGGLGNPTVDGYVLSSTATGTRSWVAGGGGSGALDMPVVAHIGAYTAVLADKGKLIDATGTWTLSLTAAATLGDGWTIALVNSGTGTITIGTLNSMIAPNDSILIGCDGTNFKIIARTTNGLVDRTGITTAATMAIGERWKIDFTAAATVPLYCTTATGQAYRILLECDCSATPLNINLNPNDTTYASAMSRVAVFSYNNIAAGRADAVSAYQFVYGANNVIGDMLVSTETTRKRSLAQSMGQEGVYYYSANTGTLWGDTTTLHTSLGTLENTSTGTLTGRVILERVL